MQIALLIGANPKTVGSGAVVRLLKGKWVLIFEGLKDSTFRLNFEDSTSLHLPYTKQFEVASNEFVFISIEEKGSEESISIFAKRVE